MAGATKSVLHVLRQRWKRCGVVLAFLVAGAVLTVMVAWACDVWAPLMAGRSSGPGEGPAEIDRLLPTTWLTATHGGYVAMRTSRAEAIGASVHTRDVEERTRGCDVFMKGQMHVHCCGWPARAMTARVFATPGNSPQFKQPANTDQGREGIAVPDWLPVHQSDPTHIHPFNRAIAFMPLPMGFAVDTVFYAGVCAIPWGVLKLRGWRRRAKGLCIRCAYPVGGSPVCTECGAEIVPPHAAAA